jgi:hypothetical protein
VDGQDRQLLEGAVAQRVLDTGPQRLGGGRRAGQQQDLLGRRAGRDEVREAVDERLRPAAAGAAQDKQRPAAPVEGGRLAFTCEGADPRIWP